LPEVTFCSFAVVASIVVYTFLVSDVAALVVLNCIAALLTEVTSCVVSLMCFNVDNCSVWFLGTSGDCDMMVVVQLSSLL